MKSVSSSTDLPAHKWTRRLSDPEPDPLVHTFSRPPIMEALSLLPVAARVGKYIWNERRHKREPIFDLNGMMLEPPKPGPYAGCPLGGIGGGCIGRGYRGDFRRWSLYPGKYSHEIIHSNQFSIRVRSQSGIYSKVLSVFDGRDAGLLSTWNWGVPREKVTYHALFPRAWTEVLEPVPGVNVIIHQISPVFPDCYLECSVPGCVFEVEVINISTEDLECSVMFTWENSDGHKREDMDLLEKESGYLHDVFTIPSDGVGPTIVGICQSHHHITRLSSSLQLAGDDTSTCDESLLHSQSPSIEEPNRTWSPFGCKKVSNERIYWDQGSFAVAAATDIPSEVSVCEKFSVDKSRPELTFPDELWERFHQSGTLVSSSSLVHEDLQRTPSECRVGSAIAISRKVLPGCTESFNFSVAWDNPIVRFGEGRAYYRFYTRVFGCSGLASPIMAAYALSQKERWKSLIIDWQNKIQNDQSLPSYYRSQLFNELYFLVDGGTLWIDGEVRLPERPTGGVDVLAALPCTHISFLSAPVYPTLGITSSQFRTSLFKISQSSLCSKISEACAQLDEAIRIGHGNCKEVGRFLYLEGHEYLMYNTYDVHFYAGFALLMCWPQLELSLQRDIAAAVSLEDMTQRIMLGEGHYRPRKVEGAVPHDVGSPSEDPLCKTNIYNFQDVSLWKDLGPKFILQVYRDYLITQTPWFLVDLYPVTLQVMKKTLEFDQDGDGMIENQGFPDQTYDIWTATGVHAYCGGLWIASCYAIAEMAKIMNDEENQTKYHAIAERAKLVYEKALWNGAYFNYDNSTSVHHDSIMADMLAGQWYASVCGLPRIVSAEKSLSSLLTIFRYNVQMFSPGKLSGAVNGMRPNGTIDTTCLQSREVWTGTTYALAATMIHEYYSESQNRTQNMLLSPVNPSDGIDTATPVKPLNPSSSDEEQTLLEMAFQTAEGIYAAGNIIRHLLSCYLGWMRYGYWFATPEAWELSGNFRSLGYMRPLSIWAMQFALQQGRGGNWISTDSNGIIKLEEKEEPL